MKNMLRFMQWVALTFVLVLGTLMAHDAFRDKRAVDATRLQLDELKLNDMDDPELGRVVRELDYAYRATYFQTKDRQAYGFLLLSCGFCLLCGMMIAERFLFAPELEIPKPQTSIPAKERRLLLVFSTCGLILLCGILVVLRMTHSLDSSVETAVNAGVDEPVDPVDPINDAPSPEIAVVETEREEISLTTALEEQTHHWPQFRGSVLPNQNTLPANWDFDEKWRIAVPFQGFNSPVVWGDNIFLGSGDATERAVFCYNAEDGEQRWKVTCTEVTDDPRVDDQTGYSAPTLCVDSRRVYGIFATGEMVCCTHDGEIVWKKQLPLPDISYGYASSPLLLGDRLIVQYAMRDTQTIYALDVFTGEAIWQTDRHSGCSWGSPTALFRDGKALIFVAGEETANVLDAETGDVIWTHEVMMGEVAASAFAAGDVFYFSNERTFTGAFAADDGTIICQNDGALAPDVASTVFYDGMFFLFTSFGTVTAIDAETAEELYEHDFDNGFYASPVIVENKIVAVNLDGELLRLTATREELIVEGNFPLEAEVSATPAFHRGNIIIRTSDNDLICLEEKPE